MRCASLSFRFSGLGNVEEDDIQLFSNPISFIFLFQSLSLSISVSFSFFFIPVYLSSYSRLYLCQSLYLLLSFIHCSNRSLIHCIFFFISIFPIFLYHFIYFIFQIILYIIFVISDHSIFLFLSFIFPVFPCIIIFHSSSKSFSLSFPVTFSLFNDPYLSLFHYFTFLHSFFSLFPYLRENGPSTASF